MIDWDNILGDGYFETMRDRLYDDTEPLVWPQQVADILGLAPQRSQVVLIEAGCCVGAAYKTFRQRYYVGTDGRRALKYVGLDFVPRYIEEATSYFANDIAVGNCKFIVHDITKPFHFHVTGDYVVCSACLEHLRGLGALDSALTNLMMATSTHLVIRTFLGKDYEHFTSDIGLPINQYPFDFVLGRLGKDFNVKVHRDRYTDSMPQLVHGVVRTFYIVSAIRR